MAAVTVMVQLYAAPPAAEGTGSDLLHASLPVRQQLTLTSVVGTRTALHPLSLWDDILPDRGAWSCPSVPALYPGLRNILWQAGVPGEGPTEQGGPLSGHKGEAG